MYPHELIGENALRTKPVDLKNGNKDYSFTTSPLRILAVTENHIVVEILDSIHEDKKHILDLRWLDNNWSRYDDLMNLANEEHIKMMKNINN